MCLRRLGRRRRSEHAGWPATLSLALTLTLPLTLPLALTQPLAWPLALAWPLRWRGRQVTGGGGAGLGLAGGLQVLLRQLGVVDRLGEPGGFRLAAIALSVPL